MTKIAFIFPGQGSQSVGMGYDVASASETSQSFFQRADDVLAIPLSSYMINGPQETLTLTYHAQPALLTVGAMIADRLQSAGIQPNFMAGHSLGEYTALVASRVMSFEAGVRAVYQRGLFMNEAVPAGKGGMAAILGLDLAIIEEITEKITAQGLPVQPANLNCPGQIVISGAKEGVEQACVALKEAGAKRAILLDVSGPFHSVLMKPAAQKLAETLHQIEMNDAEIPIVSNVTAKPVTNDEEIRQLLVEQLSAPVRWEESVRYLIEQGVTQFIECGPGKVLSGLVRKINRQVTVHAVQDEASLQATIEAVKECSK